MGRPVVITVLDFADDLALVISEIDHAQELLTRLENKAAKVHLNVKKTEMMIFNQVGDVNIQTNNGNNIKIVDNFKYLGSYMSTVPLMT